MELFENYLADNEIVNIVKEYIANNIYNYAVLIDGEWGCGKTYFIKNILMNEINKEIEENEEYDYKKIIYISLYGIKSTEDISKQIYINVIDKNKMNEGDIGRKVKSICGSGLKIFADIINNTKGINLYESMNILEDFIDMSKYILIFDDLERCNCDINEVLGYINNFVEHDNAKVILVANEKEIGKCNELQNVELKYLLAMNNDILVDEEENNIQGKLQGNQSQSKMSIKLLKNRVNKIFNRNILYEKIKEKLVGVTIKYRPDVDKVCDEIIETNIADESLKKIILQFQKDNIKFAYEKKHLNFRTFQFFLSKITTINKIIKSIDVENYKQIMSLITTYCFKVSVIYKAGMYNNNWEDKSIYGEICLGEEFSFKDYHFGFKFVDEYVLYEKFDKEEIRRIIDKYNKEQIESAHKGDDPLKNIKVWWEMDESEVNNNIEKIFKNVESNIYALSIYPRIIKVFIELVNIGFEEDIIIKMKSLILSNINKYDYEERLDDYNIRFSEKELLDKYNDIMNEVRAKLDEKKSQTKELTINKLLQDESNWGEELYDYIQQNDRYTGVQNKSIFNIIDVELLMDRIRNSNTYNVRLFLYTVNEFYRDNGINKYFVKDIYNLTEIKNQIFHIIDDEKDKLKKLALNHLKESIDEKINELKNLEEV